LALLTCYTRTLWTDEKLAELEGGLSKLRWDVGLSEVRREGNTITPKSHNLPFFQEHGQESQGGVGFIVHKSLVNNVVKIESVSTRVAYLTVEAMYEDISKAMHK
jgi:hypothetical protein